MTKKRKAKTRKASAEAREKVPGLDEVEQETEGKDQRKNKENKEEQIKIDKLKGKNNQKTEPEYKEDKMIPKEQSEEWIKKAVSIVIQHLNKFGACVIDEFLGDTKGSRILNEVLDLQKFQKFQVISEQLNYDSFNHLFQEGQLASEIAEKSVRGDKILWADGSGDHTPNINNLISMMDKIVMGANKAPNNGALSKYKISSRTRAMIACFPGEGAHYVKHVDNHQKDGRCITAIYYLNKDWVPETDGGALKVYSACVPGVIAEVNPIFDRIIFFWSDRRNPHEVMPAYRDRYAITVWYMDEKEKQEADEKKKLKVSSSSVIKKTPS